MSARVVVLVMAGGSGTRFWPLSTPKYPKQFLKLFSDRSLMQETIDRVSPLVDEKDIWICGVKAHSDLIKKELKHSYHFIAEPTGRNTSACLALSLRELSKSYSDDTVMIVVPADGYIRDEAKFRTVLGTAVKRAAKYDDLVTLGVVPTSPHTGYGYIEMGKRSEDGTSEVKRFLEKPDAKKAEELIRTENVLWNSGVFIWRLKMLRAAFEKCAPQIWKRISEAKSEDELSRIYDNVEPIAIDVSVLEKFDKVSVVPMIVGWSDVGSWDALFRLKSHDNIKNVTLAGEITLVESSGCLISVPDEKIALVGVKDLIVVRANGSLLIADRNKDQLVKKITEGKKV